MGYHAQRLALNDTGTHVRARRACPFYRAGIVSCAVDPCIVRRSAVGDLKGIAVVREDLARRFPAAAPVIYNYRPVQQEGLPACSVVGWINCARLAGVPLPGADKWKALWRAAGGAPRADIGDMLDTFGPALAGPECPWDYVPLRGTVETRRNTAHWDLAASCRHFTIPTATYDAAPFVFETGRLLETLVAQGRPVLVNALEHTRTLVGHADGTLLFADNWEPTRYQRTGQHDTFAAGFSWADKWAVYSHARDLLVPRAWACDWPQASSQRA